MVKLLIVDDPFRERYEFNADPDEFPGLPQFEMTIRWTRCPGCGVVILEFEWWPGFEWWDGHAECIDCRTVPF